jgi:lysophospholipase L1-like esterase
MPRASSPLLRDALRIGALSLLLLALLEAGCRLLGLGGPERLALPPKPPGAFRIAAFGESTVLGVPEGAYGFTSFLQHELRRLAPGRPLELLNLARSGVGSDFVLESFRQALDRAEPDLAIVLMGHNEFLVAERTRGWRGALLGLRERSRLATALARALGRGDSVEPPLPDAIAPVVPGSDFERAVIRRFGENLAAIVALARERGVPLLLCTAPANLADWPPGFLRVARADAAAHAESAKGVRALLSEGRSQQARDELRLARERFGEDAMLDWLEASALRAQGDAPRARELFARALEQDLVPRRARAAQNQLVRAAATPPGVTLVDAVELFAADAPQGLVGWELFGDNCHPTPRGHALIGRAIAAALQAQGLLVPPDAELGPVEDWLARLDARLGDAEARQLVHARWLLSNAIYAMKTPFFNFEASRRYLEELRQQAPGDWRVWANLGTLALLDGDLRRGRRDLLRATRLRGAALDPGERGSVPYLAEALSLTGVSLPRPPPRPSAGGS